MTDQTPAPEGLEDRSEPIDTPNSDRPQPMRESLARLLDNLYGLHVRPGHLDAVMDVIQVHAPVKVPVPLPAPEAVALPADAVEAIEYLRRFPHRARDGDFADLLAREAAQAARLWEELAHWKTCSLCGEHMDAPGMCSSGERERKEGYEQMYDDMLVAKEATEAERDALRGRLEAAEKPALSHDAEKGIALMRQFSKPCVGDHDCGTDHDWKNCPSCLASWEIETNEDAKGYVRTALDALLTGGAQGGE